MSDAPSPDSKSALSVFTVSLCFIVTKTKGTGGYNSKDILVGLQEPAIFLALKILLCEKDRKWYLTTWSVLFLDVLSKLNKKMSFIFYSSWPIFHLYSPLEFNFLESVQEYMVGGPLGGSFNSPSYSLSLTSRCLKC